MRKRQPIADLTRLDGGQQIMGEAIGKRAEQLPPHAGQPLTQCCNLQRHERRISRIGSASPLRCSSSETVGDPRPALAGAGLFRQDGIEHGRAGFHIGAGNRVDLYRRASVDCPPIGEPRPVPAEQDRLAQRVLPATSGAAPDPAAHWRAVALARRITSSTISFLRRLE
jgi:hypothetical protein